MTVIIFLVINLVWWAAFQDTSLQKQLKRGCSAILHFHNVLFGNILSPAGLYILTQIFTLLETYVF